MITEYDCQSIIDATSGIEELDLSVLRYNYFKRLGFQTVGQLTEKDGWFFFNQPTHSLLTLIELVEKLDAFSFRLADCSRERYPMLEPYISIYQKAEREWWTQTIAEEEKMLRAERRKKKINAKHSNRV